MNKKVLKIGFIGCGKMAGSIIKGVKSSCLGGNFEIIGSEVNNEIAELASSKLGVEVLSDNMELAKRVDVLVVATKPMYVLNILEEIKPVFDETKLLISIAAGVSTEKIGKVLPKHRIVRVMPNTPALLGVGMAGVAPGSLANEDDVDFVLDLMASVGKSIQIEERQIDVLTAISGSGPAFFYQVIEDMARAGEKLGLDYEKSLLLATQTALGSAKMVENRGELTVQNLIDNVATKGGCTFVGIQTMKSENSAAMFEKVIADTTKKASELG